MKINKWHIISIVFCIVMAGCNKLKPVNHTSKPLNDETFFIGLIKADSFYSLHTPEAYTIALHQFDSMLLIAKQSNNNLWLANSYLAMGKVYDSWNNNTQKTLFYYNQSLQTYWIDKNADGINHTTLLVAHTYLKLKDTLHTNIFAGKLDSLATNFKDNRIRNIFNVNAAYLFARIGNLKNANTCLSKIPFDERINIKNSSLNHHDYYITTQFILHLFYHHKNELSWMDSLKQCYILKSKNIEKQYFSRLIYEAYSKLNLPDSALKYLLINQQLNNAFKDGKAAETLPYRMLQAENKNAELDLKLKEKEIANKQIFIFSLLLSMALLIILIAFILNRIKLKQRIKDAVLKQQFTNQLFKNTEIERSRIARDLHDGVNQELLLLKRSLQQYNTADLIKVEAIINDVRQIARNLHPVMLDKIGLKDALENLCEKLSETEQLFISTEINYYASISKNDELQLFRIVQECLQNTIKYANAEAAKITIMQAEKNIVVEIKDNGKGFNVAEMLNSKHSFGLQSIIERAKAIGAVAEIKSNTKGTTIKIILANI